ncbi:MAG: vWA domain-containing protein [Planctomycetota bacterium]|jgi:Ca-activated chloride channel family protein
MRILLALALVLSLLFAQEAKKPTSLSYLLGMRLAGSGWPEAPDGELNIRATSLSVLALLGAGHTDKAPAPHGPAIRDGLEALAAGKATALSTLVLCEAHQITKNPRYKVIAQKRIESLAKSQREDGSFGDLVTTAWAGMALKSGAQGGLKVDAKVVPLLRVWLGKLKDGSPRATAIGTLLRIVHKGDQARIVNGASLLVKSPPSRKAIDELYWLFGTLASYQRGGRDWKAWNTAMRDAIFKTTRPDGSWAASSKQTRLTATALNALSLQVYHRYERVFGLRSSANAVIGIGGGAGGGFRGRGGRRNLRAAGGSARFNTETYDRIVSRGFRNVWDEAVSTFSVDVDTASYSNVRRFLVQHGRLPPKDAVRIEEMVNYFAYDDAPPAADSAHPFAVHLDVATCPWEPKNRLVRIGLKAKEIEMKDRPPSNLVFLVDVSGSMKSVNKLPLLKSALRLLVDRLDARDSVSIVVYAGAAGLACPPTSDRKKILETLERLKSGGSTNGGAGLELAYAIAKNQLVQGGVNRVVLCTDGDFNVGISDRGELTRRIETEAKAGVGLTVLGFGMGNYKDARLEELSNKGDGNYAYIDSLQEARKVLVEQLTGTLITVAKDAKVQVFFNPGKVASWRLIGYENRLLAKEDFNDDKKDAGEIGAGHVVTALYEVVPAGGQAKRLADENPFLNTKQLTPEAAKGALLRLRLRYKMPTATKSVLLEQDVKDEGKGYGDAGESLRWSSAVAMFGMLLRGDEHKGSSNYALCEELAKSALGRDVHGYRAQMLDLLARAKILTAVD